MVNPARLSALKDKRTWAICAAAGILVVLLIQTLQKAYRAEGYDLTSYLLSAKALLNGDNPYATATSFPYIYPLFLAFVLIPLTVIPYWLANVIWFGLSVASLIGSCWILLQVGQREVKAVLDRQLAIPGLALLLILFSPIQSTLLNGQVNLIVLFGCVMFFRCLARSSGVWAAVWLAAAIATKLLPAVLLMFLLVRRQYRVLLWTLLFAALFCMLPGLVAGKNLFAFYRSYLDSFLMPTLLHSGDNSQTMFFSLQGAVAHFIPAAQSSLWVGAACLLVSAVAMLSVDIMATDVPQSRRDLWSFCACLMGCLLISPKAETHHLAFAIPAVFLVGVKVVFDRRWAAGAVDSLAACFVVCFDILAKACKTTPLYFVSLVVLLVLLLLAARQREDADIVVLAPSGCAE